MLYLDVEYRTYYLAWISLAGNDYLTAVKHKDHVGLLILMCWGVLVDSLASAGYWWARNFGKSLVEEVSQAMRDNADAKTRHVILWAQEQVGIGRKNGVS